jgi:hypothetical protein
VRIGLEFPQAPGAAEEIIDTGVIQPMLRRRRIDRHPADRVSRLAGFSFGAGAPDMPAMLMVMSVQSHVVPQGQADDHGRNIH